MTSAQAPAPSPRWLAARLMTTAVVMTALFAGIAWKAFTVQIRDHDRMRALGEAQYLHQVELPAPRGSIVDRNGMDLAVSVEVMSVFAEPRDVDDPLGTAAALAPILKLPQGELAQKLASGKRFAWLARRVRGEQALKVRQLKLPGIGLSPEAQRFYPGGALAGPVLGVAGLDGKGLEGVELSQDEHLAGDKTKLPVLRDARGSVLFPGWDEADAHAVAGRTVSLTVDRYVQYVAERALANGVEANKAKAGLVVVLDARTAEVLAMASSPTFDPNSTGHRGDARNRPVTDTFEPGSGMKLFVVAAALEAGLVTPEELFAIDGGKLQIGRKTIRDTHFEKPFLSVSEIIKFSSNVGAVKIIRKLGKEAMIQALLAYGFAQKTGIELPGEQMGTIRSQARWGEVELATKSFGYGLRATPLQLAAALGAIANRGLWTGPRIVKEVRGGDGKLFPLEPATTRQVMSPEHADAMLAMMETVMEKGGTGEKLKVPGFRVAGKTGTSHKVDPATKKYSADRYLSSFIGVAPANDPRLVVVVFIDEPNNGKHYCGVVAGPVFVELVTETLKYLGVPATEPIEPPKLTGKALAREVAAAETEAAVPPEDEIAPLAVVEELAGAPPAGPGEAIVVIPDFTGLSVAQAVAAARAAGVRVELTGSGKAIEQYPPPGRAMKSITCRITFDPG